MCEASNSDKLTKISVITLYSIQNLIYTIRSLTQHIVLKKREKEKEEGKSMTRDLQRVIYPVEWLKWFDCHKIHIHSFGIFRRIPVKTSNSFMCVSYKTESSCTTQIVDWVFYE